MNGFRYRAPVSTGTLNRAVSISRLRRLRRILGERMLGSMVRSGMSQERISRRQVVSQKFYHTYWTTTYCLVNFFPHIGHMNGFSFVWVLKWRWRCSAFAKCCEQMEQIRSSFVVLRLRCMLNSHRNVRKPELSVSFAVHRVVVMLKKGRETRGLQRWVRGTWFPAN